MHLGKSFPFSGRRKHHHRFVDGITYVYAFDSEGLKTQGDEATYLRSRSSREAKPDESQPRPGFESVRFSPLDMTFLCVALAVYLVQFYDFVVRGFHFDLEAITSEFSQEVQRISLV